MIGSGRDEPGMLDERRLEGRVGNHGREYRDSARHRSALCERRMRTRDCSTALTPEKEAEVNGVIAGRVAALTIQGEPRTLISKDVRLDGAIVRFRPSDPASPAGEAWLPETERPLGSLRQIEFLDRGHYVLYGLGIGAGIGAVVGAIALSGIRNGED